MTDSTLNTHALEQCQHCGKELPGAALNRDGVCFLCVADSFGFGSPALPATPEHVQAVAELLKPPAGVVTSPVAPPIVVPSAAELDAAAERQSAHAARLRRESAAIDRAGELLMRALEAGLKVAPHLLEQVTDDPEKSARKLRDGFLQLVRLDRVPGL